MKKEELLKLEEMLLSEGGEMYPADNMTMKELKIACYAAQNILDRLEDGAMIQRWQISAIVKASEELASVYTSMSADEGMEDDDEEDMMDYDMEYDEYGYPSMYEETDYAVDIEGLPKMYMKGKSPMDVKSILRKVIRKPDMIQRVERTTKSELRKAFMLKAQGKEEIDESTDLRITKVYNKKGVTYAVHSPDRKYYKEFDTMNAAKNHYAEKTDK